MAELDDQAFERLHVRCEDAVSMTASDLAPTSFVANLPYNTGVPILQRARAVRHSRVRGHHGAGGSGSSADRRARLPRPRDSPVKAAWWATTRWLGKVPADVFWPTPTSNPVWSVSPDIRRRPRNCGSRRSPPSMRRLLSAGRCCAALRGGRNRLRLARCWIRQDRPGRRGESLSVQEFRRWPARSSGFAQ